MDTYTGGFTALDLQNELKADLEALFDNFTLRMKSGETRKPTVYLYNLPVPETDDDTEMSYMPYIIIRTNAGKIEDWDTSDQIKELTALLLIGLYNTDTDRSGALDVMAIIQTIENHLGKTRRVGNFTVGRELQWVISDADTHPYYFGGVTVKFEAPRVIKEDPLV